MFKLGFISLTTVYVSHNYNYKLGFRKCITAYKSLDIDNASSTTLFGTIFYSEIVHKELNESQVKSAKM